MSERSSLFADVEDDTWQRRRHTDNSLELDITPMIDVTFLLLIFFMVTSTMQATPDLDVPAAVHGVGLESRTVTAVQVKNPAGARADMPVILVDRDGRDREVSLIELEQFITAQLLKGISHTIIKADRDVPHGLVQQVTRAVTNVEGASFSIGVRDAQGKR